MKYENPDVRNVITAAYSTVSKCGTIVLHISIGIALGVMSLIGFSMEQNNLKGLMWVQTITDTLSCIIAIVVLYNEKKRSQKIWY